MKFSIRDLLLVTVIVAIMVAWWLDHRRQMAGIEKQMTGINKLKDYLNTRNEYDKALAKYTEQQRKLQEKVIQLLAEQKKLKDAIRAMQLESRNSSAPGATQPKHKNLNDGDRLPRPSKRGIPVDRILPA